MTANSARLEPFSNLFFSLHINKLSIWFRWLEKTGQKNLIIYEILIFETMQLVKLSRILLESTAIKSEFLQREVKIDFFLPKNVSDPSIINLLLINDGQNLFEMGFAEMLEQLYTENIIEPMFCAGVYAGEDRKMEYGIASQPDYLGRGAKAGLYSLFVLNELLPFIYKNYFIHSFKEKAFAGFSLGGLSALDIVWNHPDKFSKVGVFSGSFWWRSIDQDNEKYDDDKHRIMQQQVRNSGYKPGLKFFFQCGNKDETKDRNKNGIIDSVDDTLDLIKELTANGYDADNDIKYVEMKEGKHDIGTWAKAMPEFIKWGWKNK